ncbi:hypothetical protein PR048_000113 [Dryococelus australis]|uniref:Uncharacterized protein n=1 Tax=Dryococelus australis TaxID=614101 RepID=A0ABQ9IDS0_9NEOP|nr:hypothetical protein PR048_000113 [Dryococelus australis]
MKISKCTDVLEFRHPARLPADHPVIMRLTYGLHVEFNNVGAQGLLSLLQKKFRILREIGTARSVIRKCTVRRIFVGHNVNQVSPPFLEDRACDAAVFQVSELTWQDLFTSRMYVKLVFPYSLVQCSELCIFN